jgi:hypothetical protein
MRLRRLELLPGTKLVVRGRPGDSPETGREVVPAVLQRPAAWHAGPRRISKQELRDAFAQGWEIESIRPTRVETRPDLKDFTFSAGGAKAWFPVSRRPA